MYNKHVMIYTTSYSWSTLLRHFSYTEQEIDNHCDVKLILLGEHKYAHVRPIRPPFGTIPKPFNTCVSVKNEDSKDGIKSHIVRSKRPTTVSKITCRGQTLAKKPNSSNISSSNIIANTDRPHNTTTTNQKRISPKPLWESRHNINYAKLNDGLEPTRSPSPKCKKREKLRPKTTGPSATHEAAHAMAMHKKLSSRTTISSTRSVTPTNASANVLEKENELADLEKIMDSFENEERVIGTIIKYDNDNLHGLSDSPPRITLGNISANLTADNINIPTTPETYMRTNDKRTTNLAGVTNSPNNEHTETHADQEDPRKLRGVTVDTMVSIDITNMTDLLKQNNHDMQGEITNHMHVTPEKSVTPSNDIAMPTEPATKGVRVTDSPKLNKQDVQGVITKHSEATTRNSVTPSNDMAIPMKPVTEEAHMASSSPHGLINVGDAAILPQTDDVNGETSELPDLVIEKTTRTDKARSPLRKNRQSTSVTLDKTSEYDFPPLSSDEENNNRNITFVSNDSHECDIHLTEEEDEAVNALLSLSKSLPSNGENDTDVNDNSEILPIGKLLIDAVPVPIRLSQDNVNAEINRLNLCESSNKAELKPKSSQATTTTTTIVTSKTGAILSSHTEERPSTLLTSPTVKSTQKSCEDSPGSPQGKLQLKSYRLKMKSGKTRNFTCKSCGAAKRTVQELNDHHKRNHKQVMCGTCNKLFDAPLQLARHMYEHYEKTLQCDPCEQSFVFQSELDKHKINHRKNPSHKCMKPKCGRWFFRIQDLNFHLLTHEDNEFKCTKCDKFATSTEKYLKDHIKSVHGKQLPYKCEKCSKRFMYRQQRKRHLESDHKRSKKS